MPLGNFRRPTAIATVTRDRGHLKKVVTTKMIRGKQIDLSLKRAITRIRAKVLSLNFSAKLLHLAIEGCKPSPRDGCNLRCKLEGTRG
jgi:hypothetical protein